MRLISGRTAGLHLPFVLQLGIVFMVAVTVFLLLRTSDYLAVDGALRALAVHHGGRLLLHTNNHLLYPVNLWIWTSGLAAVGVVPRDSLEFLRLAQAMNAVAAAAVLTIMWGLTFKITSSVAASCLVALGYGMSRSFSAHATNSAEPMVGLLWSAGALALVASCLRRPKYGRLLAAGFLLSLSMATYQSMVLIGPALLTLIWTWPRSDQMDHSTGRRARSTLALGCGCVFGVVAIYATAYYWSGTREIGAMIDRFREVRSADVYAGVTPMKVAALVPGLAYALLPCLPRECGGFSCLTDPRHRAWLSLSILAVLAVCACILVIALTVRKYWPLTDPFARAGLFAGGIALVCTTVPLASWMPTYDKLWLQPLAGLFVISALLVKITHVSMAAPSHRLRSIGVAVVLLAACNVPRLLAGSWRPTPYLAEAREVATVVRAQDLLVGDWNDVFIIYQYFWATRGNSFNLPNEAEREGPHAVRSMVEAIERTGHAGDAVLFLGLLDVSRDDWGAVLGRRGLRYEDLECYRRSAETVLRVRYEGSHITLRRMRAGSCRGLP